MCFNRQYGVLQNRTRKIQKNECIQSNKSKTRNTRAFNTK